MLTALTWYSLEHMHTHVVCERPASYPGQAIPRLGNFLGLAPQKGEPGKNKAPAVPPRPLGITLVLTLSAPTGPGPWSVLEMLWIFSSW